VKAGSGNGAAFPIFLPVFTSPLVFDFSMERLKYYHVVVEIMVTLSLHNLTDDERIKITKGAAVLTTFDEETGGVIDILVFNEAIVENRDFIRPVGGFAIRMVFRRSKYADNLDPCSSGLVSQYLPYRYLDLGELPCTEGQLLYTREPRKVFNTFMGEDKCHRTSLIINNLDVEIFASLIKAFKCVGLTELENIDKALIVIKQKYKIFQEQVFYNELEEKMMKEMHI